MKTRRPTSGRVRSRRITVRGHPGPPCFDRIRERDRERPAHRRVGRLDLRLPVPRGPHARRGPTGSTAGLDAGLGMLLVARVVAERSRAPVTVSPATTPARASTWRRVAPPFFLRVLGPVVTVTTVAVLVTGIGALLARDTHWLQLAHKASFARLVRRHDPARARSRAGRLRPWRLPTGTERAALPGGAGRVRLASRSLALAVVIGLLLAGQLVAAPGTPVAPRTGEAPGCAARWPP